MINKDRTFFQYSSGDLVYIISPLTSQLHMASWKVTIKYVGPVVIYKIIDPHNYRLMTLDGRILRGLFEHERLKFAYIRTSQRNSQTLAQFKQIMNASFTIHENLKATNILFKNYQYKVEIVAFNTLNYNNQVDYTKIYNNLITSHDLYCQRLINSFMHSNFAGEAIQPIAQTITITEADSF